MPDRYKTILKSLPFLMLLFIGLQATDISPAFAEDPLPADPAAQLPVEELSIATRMGTFRFSAEIADDARERSIGLMHRETMLPTHGMLFQFSRSRIVTMWMKNTPLSLDMVFIKQDGTVANIAPKTTPFSTDIISSGVPVSHVLELRAGTALQIGLQTGDKIMHRFFQ